VVTLLLVGLLVEIIGASPKQVNKLVCLWKTLFTTLAFDFG